MSAVSITPSPAFQTFQFTDVDEFRAAVRKFSVDFTPLARKISVRQSILNLADFDITVVHSFPRIADTQLAANCTAICLTMDDDDLVRFNGVDVGRAYVGIGYGGNDFSIVERAGARLASINFTPEIHDRGWPETSRHFSVFLAAISAHQKLRLLVSEIMKFASEAPDLLMVPKTMSAIRETLLLAVDQVFESTKQPWARKSLHSAQAFATFQRVEALLREELKSPIYSDALANAAGISVRALQDVISQYRGMSLHRYLRLKRLWLVRKRLLIADQISVKACALEFGFWHMSDFSRSYQAHFGETPGQTLARAR
jgi:AraC family ethanolamine operon transcriptional activator